MTLPDALRASGRESSIRRRNWVPGFCIVWSYDRLCWVYGNVFDKSPLDSVEARHLYLTLGQGCLTPMSMIADDWEVAP